MAKKAMLVVVLVIKPITNTTTNKLLAVKGLYKTGSRTRTVIPSAIQPVLTQTRHVGTL